MPSQIRNISQRPVGLHLNSGRTIQLASGAEIELPEVEIANNASCAKLESRKLLAIVNTTRGEEASEASGSSAEKPGTRNMAKGPNG